MDVSSKITDGMDGMEGIMGMGPVEGITGGDET